MGKIILFAAILDKSEFRKLFIVTYNLYYLLSQKMSLVLGTPNYVLGFSFMGSIPSGSTGQGEGGARGFLPPLHKLVTTFVLNRFRVFREESFGYIN